MSNEILINYDKNIKMYTDYKSKIEILLKELLINESINYHHISSRVKDKSSLSKKISQKDKYNKIEDITDILGCRIITYFDDDVETVVKTLKEEFDIDEKNSINKKDNISSDKFGYLSYHLICKLKDERTKLKEYKRYKNIQFEIQIRTILQHAWAEIEHDLGYKSKIEIPSILRRKFSRIAGLLETADESFCDIKNKLNDYNESLQDDKTLMGEDINLNSLFNYLKSNKLVMHLDSKISLFGNWNKVRDTEKDYLSADLRKLAFFNITTIEELDKLIINKKDEILTFAEKFLKDIDESHDSIPEGISLFYLFYILAFEREILLNYLQACAIGADEIDRENNSQNIINILSNI